MWASPVEVVGGQVDLPQAGCDDGDAQVDLMCGDALYQGDAVPVTGYPSCRLDSKALVVGAHGHHGELDGRCRSPGFSFDGASFMALEAAKAAASSPAMIHMTTFTRHSDHSMTSTVESTLALVTSAFKSMRVGSLQS
jgi:hypothetical protein